jgi:hypothetical protein
MSANTSACCGSRPALHEPQAMAAPALRQADMHGSLRLKLVIAALARYHGGFRASASLPTSCSKTFP